MPADLDASQREEQDHHVDLPLCRADRHVPAHPFRRLRRLLERLLIRLLSQNAGAKRGYAFFGYFPFAVIKHPEFSEVLQ